MPREVEVLTVCSADDITEEAWSAMGFQLAAEVLPGQLCKVQVGLVSTPVFSKFQLEFASVKQAAESDARRGVSQ